MDSRFRGNGRYPIGGYKVLLGRILRLPVLASNQKTVG
jgi:hypothetical protein